MIVRCEYDFDNLPPLTEEEIKMLDALEQMDDSKIDFSDIPALTPERLKRFKRASDLLEHRKRA